MTTRWIIGAMSGTSADGVDAALVRIDGHGLAMTASLACHRLRPFSPELRETIFELRSAGQSNASKQTTPQRETSEPWLAKLARIGREITHAYAEVVREVLMAANVAASDVAAIAAHGQTLFHAPPLTIQWFDPSLLAWETGCAVVSDFRRADCAAGGQGAPLVPFADYILFSDTQRHRAVLNIGGIANFTWLPAGGSIDKVIALDTGPGNCISDWICRRYGPFGLSWDVDGAGASRGMVIHELAQRFLAHSYFSMPLPKSTDTPTMIAAFEQALGDGEYPMNDLLATAAWLTATTITQPILARRESPELDLIVSGGGTYNKAIMCWIRIMLGPGVRVRFTDDFGVSSAAKEAIAFALLGAATLDGIPSNVPSVTGAKRPVILGSISPRPKYAVLIHKPDENVRISERSS